MSVLFTFSSAIGEKKTVSVCSVIGNCRVKRIYKVGKWRGYGNTERITKIYKTQVYREAVLERGVGLTLETNGIN